ncbi:unnamed protein product [Orchesella dallaii]|uniref:Chitin-binding type-2 domain-containing protein n=1 Tax=Orchesella dallaii TaxID=48710 RepID=A0ABP1RXX7_9HEXA
MRLLVLSCVALIVWQGFVRTKADGFAAVSGTGWTDISQLQSNCDIPGYFVNSADCSRFYICVDHSTPEHRLLLRYDFDCPGGLAFDESQKICNYPGPSGCVYNGGGGGSGGSGGGGWGWSKNPGIFQSTSTVSKGPSWGTPTRNPVVGSGTIFRVSTGGSGGGGVVRIPSAPAGYPANPTVNLPSQQVLQVPPPQWESYRIQSTNPGVFESAKVTGGTSGGWEANRVLQPLNTGVFQSARLTPNAPNSVSWSASKVTPGNPGVFQSNRVTQVPQAEWEVPREFPAPPQTQTVFQQKVVEGHSGSWQGDRGNPAPANAAINWEEIRVSQTPAPANPAIEQGRGWESIRVSTSPAPANPAIGHGQGWESIRVSPSPAPANPAIGQGVRWESYRVSSSPAPANPAIGQGVRWESISASPSPAPSNPSQGQRIDWESLRGSPPPAPANPAVGQNYIYQVNTGPKTIQVQPPGAWQTTRFQGGWNSPEAANPSINIRGQSPAPANPGFALPGGTGQWNNVRITQIPSGYAWQTNSVVKEQQNAETAVSTQSTPVETTSTGDFSIVQQVINEEQQGGGGGDAGKSHIQQIYENKEKQNANNALPANTSEKQVGPQQSNSVDLSNPVYQIIASRNSAVKGRIIVLYAPINSAGKREVPVVEVQVENTDDSGESAENQQ